LPDFFPRVMELCRINGAVMQLPRNFDARLLFYRADLIAAPPSWEDAAALMVRHAGPGFYGFAFPGRHSGLFGTFYELLGMAGGDLFDAQLHPIFNDAAGVWALRFLHRLHTVDRVTPPDLLERWYYDEVSTEFRAGHVLMIGDWPGFYGLYKDPQTCAVIEQFEIARSFSSTSGRPSAISAFTRDSRRPRMTRRRTGTPRTSRRPRAMWRARSRCCGISSVPKYSISRHRPADTRRCAVQCLTG